MEKNELLLRQIRNHIRALKNSLTAELQGVDENSSWLEIFLHPEFNIESYSSEKLQPQNTADNFSEEECSFLHNLPAYYHITKNKPLPSDIIFSVKNFQGCTPIVEYTIETDREELWELDTHICIGILFPHIIIIRYAKKIPEFEKIPQYNGYELRVCTCYYFPTPNPSGDEFPF